MFPIDPERDVTLTAHELALIRRDPRLRKRAYIASRLSATASNGGSQEHAAKSYAVSHKSKQGIREVEARCREIIDAFGLHPLKFREGCSRRV